MSTTRPCPLRPDAAGGAEEELVQFTATDISLKARFASKELKAAATELDATLTIGGEEWAQAVTLTLNGRSRAKMGARNATGRAGRPWRNDKDRAGRAAARGGGARPGCWRCNI